MHPAGAISNAFGTYDWDAEVYGALWAASRVAASIKHRANVLRIAYRLRELNRTLTSFFDTVHATMEGKKPADPDAPPLTPERLRSTADNLEHLNRIIEYVYETMRRVGLTNNSLTAGSLRSIHKHGEELLDLAEWFELTATPEQAKFLFDRAEHESKQGEVYDLSQVN